MFSLLGKSKEYDIGDWRNGPELREAENEIISYSVETFSPAYNFPMLALDFNTVDLINEGYASEINTGTFDRSASGSAKPRGRKIMNYGGTTVSLSAGVNMTGPNTAIVVGTSSNWIWAPGLTHDTTTDTHDAQMSVNVSDSVEDPLNVSYNKTHFKSDEQVVVTVVRPGIRSAYLFIDGENTTSGLSNGSDTIELSSGFPDLDFSESNQWHGNAALYISYMSESGIERWTYHNQDISVEKAYTSSTGNKPDPPATFSLEKGQYKRSLRLTWTKSDSDGGSPIDEYQYQYRHWKEGSGWQLPSGWESAGKGTSKLISGLRSKTKYCVRMRAKNKAGKHSDMTNWSSTVMTR